MLPELSKCLLPIPSCEVTTYAKPYTVYTLHKCNLSKTCIWCRASNDLVILCDLYVCSLCIQLVHLFSVSFRVIRHVYSSRSVFRHFLHTMLPLEQPSLLIKFSFESQSISVLRYMRLYHKCHPNNIFKE